MSSYMESSCMHIAYKPHTTSDDKIQNSCMERHMRVNGTEEKKNKRKKAVMDQSSVNHSPALCFARLRKMYFE